MRGPKGGFDIGTHEATIQVIFIKTWPDASAELLGLSQARDVCSRSVLKRTAGPKSAIGHADAGCAPIIVGKGAADKPRKRMRMSWSA